MGHFFTCGTYGLLDERPELSDLFTKPPSDLAERTVLNGVDEFGEYVLAVINRSGKPVEATLALPGVPFLEIVEAIQVKLFFGGRGSDHRVIRPHRLAVPVAVLSDERALAVVNLAFEGVRCRLDLASLVAALDRAEHAALFLDIFKLLQHGLLNRFSYDAHPW